MPRANAPFTLDSLEEDPPYDEEVGVSFGRARIAKTFHGDLEATSTVEMLSARTAGPGAGYVALERIRGVLHGRRGSFALLHIGTMDADGYWAKLPIVPQSGTGELAGIAGSAEIDIDPGGAHTLHLDYEL